MKYPKMKLFTLALLGAGTSASTLYGVSTSNLALFKGVSQGPVQMLRSAFITHWYFGIGLAVLVIMITSIYYGEKQQEITISGDNKKP